MYKKHIYNDPTVETAVETIFQPDEMALRTVPKDMSEAELLEQEGIFFLKDVCRCLNLKPGDLKRRAQNEERQGQDPWKTMGIRKTWTHWIVRMVVFRHFIKQAQPVRIRRVKPDWDANALLSHKGCFLLTEVCSKLPFTPSQIRQEVRGQKESRERFGVWKDENHKGYLVEMEIFSNWIKKVW
jgi:hypothetical protein